MINFFAGTDATSTVNLFIDGTLAGRITFADPIKSTAAVNVPPLPTPLTVHVTAVIVV